MTGVGTRALFQAMETRHQRAPIVAALAAITTVARGPKAIRAMRDLGIEPSIVVPEPNTWREVLSALASQVELKGKRVAIQEYGVSNRELTAGLEARGARVTIVPVYRWTLPADRAPLRAALNAIAAGAADVAIFTSSNQVTNVIQLAEAEGIGDGVKRGFARMAVGSIGPVCSEQIRAYGLRVDFEPEHSKLGHLVKAAAAQAASILIANRADTHRIEAGAAPNPRRPAISERAAISARRPSDAQGVPARSRPLHSYLADAPGGPLHAGVSARSRASWFSRDVQAARVGRRSHRHGGRAAQGGCGDHFRRYPAASDPDGSRAAFRKRRRAGDRSPDSHRGRPRTDSRRRRGGARLRWRRDQAGASRDRRDHSADRICRGAVHARVVPDRRRLVAAIPGDQNFHVHAARNVASPDGAAGAHRRRII